MTESQTTTDEVVLRRRRFLRSGALLAAAAGGAVAAGASAAVPAAAATGASVLLGTSNTADKTTAITTSDPAQVPLKLTSAGGAALELATSGSGSAALALNQLAGTSEGPLVGAWDADEEAVYTDYVATLYDVAQTPVVTWYYPERILDTSSSKNRGAVVAKSSGALDSKGRLQKGAWIDVAVEATDLGYTPDAAFVTITSSGSSKDGSLSAYVTGFSRGGTVAVSFLKKKTISGSTFVGLTKLGDAFVFRIYASQKTYVSVDLTGISYYNRPGPDAPQAQARSAGRAARKAARKTARPTVRSAR